MAQSFGSGFTSSLSLGRGFANDRTRNRLLENEYNLDLDKLEEDRRQYDQRRRDDYNERQRLQGNSNRDFDRGVIESDRTFKLNEGRDAREKSVEGRAKTEEEERLEKQGGRIAISNITQFSGVDKAQQNWTELLANPDQNANVIALAQNGRFNSFTKEDGTVVPATLVSFELGETSGEYVPLVKRSDTGEVVPMTRNRTDQADDGLVALTAEQLDTHLTSRYQNAASNGARENNYGVMMTNAETLKQWLAQETVAGLKREIETAVVGNPNLANAQRSELYFAINDTDDPVAIRKIAALAGIDVEAKEARINATATEQWNASKGTGSLEKLLIKEGVSKEDWEGFDRETKDRVLENLQQKQTGGIATTISNLRGAGAKFGDVGALPLDLLEKAYDEAANTQLGRFVGLSGIADEPPGKMDVNTFSDKEREVRARKSIPVTEERIDSVFKGPDPVPMSVEDIQAAITNKNVNPTPQQLKEVGDFLGLNKIATDEDLVQKTADGTISKKDALSAAWAMATTTEGSTAEKLESFNSLNNLIQRGDTEYSRKEELTLAESVKDNRLKRDETIRKNDFDIGQARKEWEFTRAEKFQGIDDKSTEDALAAGDKLLDNIAVIMGTGTMSDDGKTFVPNGKEARLSKDSLGDSRKIAAQLRPFIAKMRTAAKLKDGKSLAAWTDPYNAAVSTYFQALESANPSSLEFGFGALFRDDININQVDFDLQQIQVSKKDKTGNPSHITYVDKQLGRMGDEVALEDIYNIDKFMHNILSTAALANQKAGRDAAGVE